MTAAISPVVVVTGANGLVGTAVCRALAERSARVRAVVRRAGTAPVLDGVTEVVGSGGGMDNPVLVEALRRALAPVPLRRSDDLGLPSDGKEALLTVLLGALTWHGVPGVVPGATGSAVPRVLGRISPGNAPLRMPDPAGPVHALRLVTGSEAGR